MFSIVTLYCIQSFSASFLSVFSLLYFAVFVVFTVKRTNGTICFVCRVLHLFRLQWTVRDWPCQPWTSSSLREVTPPTFWTWAEVRRRSRCRRPSSCLTLTQTWVCVSPVWGNTETQYRRRERYKYEQADVVVRVGSCYVISSRGEIWCFECDRSTYHNVYASPSTRVSFNVHLFVFRDSVWKSVEKFTKCVMRHKVNRATTRAVR